MVNGRVILDITKVHPDEIADKTNVPTEVVRKVLGQIIKERENNKRKPREPAPEGGISLSEAERKYKIPNQTISRWVSKGLIRIIKRTNRELYINEPELIKIAEHYNQNPGQGKKTVSALFKQK